MGNNDQVNERLEAAIYNIERALLNDIKSKDDEIKTLSQKKQDLEKTLQLERQKKDDLTKQLEMELVTKSAAEQRVDELQDELLTVHSQLKRVAEEKERLKSGLADLEDAVCKYVEQVTDIVTAKDNNIQFLRNRLAVTEQSTKFRLGSALVNSAKNPITLPKNSYLIARMFAGSVRRKLKGIKKKYRLIELPYDEPLQPESPLVSIDDDNRNVETAHFEKLNELLLAGLREPTSLADLKVAAILDDYSAKCFAPECQLITFRPDNWREVFHTEFPHLLLVESAWAGNSGSWKYKIAQYDYEQGPELDELLAWCRKNDVPTVFWNREDSVHFNQFVHTATKFDTIFTSDAGTVEQYKKIADHDQVYVMPFAVQPRLHNPTKINKYKQLDVCSSDSEKAVYKQYKVFVHNNSATALSQLVIEALACGTMIISPHHGGIQDEFVDKVLLVNNDDKEMQMQIDQVLTNAEWRTKKEVSGIRAVFNGHTYGHRLHEIAEKCGFILPPPYDYKVGLIGKPNSLQEAERIVAMFARQSYPNLRLYLFLDDGVNIHTADDRVTVMHRDDEDAAFSEDYIGVLSPDHYYGENYVTDLINGIKYSGADIVGKAEIYEFDLETSTLTRRNAGMTFVYTSDLVPEASLSRTSWLADLNGTNTALLTEGGLRQAGTYGARMYAVDAYNFLYNASFAKDEQYEQLVHKVTV